MPQWVVFLGASAFVVTSIYTLWTKAIRPGAKVIAEWERMLPVWRNATRALEDVPEAFSVLKEIVSQVRNNAGSSMLDMLEKLSRQADEDRQATRIIAINLEADRQLAIRDREQVARLLVEQDRITQRLNQAIDALSEMANADHVVAINLSAAQSRAESAPTDPGAAADAASKPAPDDE